MNRKFGLQYAEYEVSPEAQSFPVTNRGVRMVWAKDFDEACTKAFPKFKFNEGTNRTKCGRFMDENGYGKGVLISWNGKYSDNMEEN